MCETYGCRFRREAKSAGMHGGGGVSDWIGRIRAAADWTGATWLVVLEDDVRVDGPITRWPAADAVGKPERGAGGRTAILPPLESSSTLFASGHIT